MISAGQIYQGIASRYVFPPDVDEWWGELGSYEIRIEKVGRIWFHFRSYCISRDGTRILCSERRAKLEDLRREIGENLVALKPRTGPEVSLELED
jgi:hypothetical protein